MAFTQSWNMLKASVSVLRTRKELAIFPVLSGIASIVVAVSFLVSAVVINRGSDATIVNIALVISMYLAMAYVTIFCNAALISQANVALQGGDPSVWGGLRVAGARWLRILPWAVLSATVSWLIRAARERATGLTTIVTGTSGIAWQAITFLVLPKLVLEEQGLISSMKDSAQSLRNTWGENIIGSLGITLLGFALALPGVGIAVLAFQTSGAVMATLIAVSLAWLLATAIIVTALTGIYQTALYQYVRNGTVPASFAGADLPNAFAKR